MTHSGGEAVDLEVLVKKAQKGDDEAFYALINTERDKLYGIAYNYLKNKHDALEAIQEVTCRGYVKLNRLKEPKYFSSWIVKIMINYCIDELKRTKRTIPMEQMEYFEGDNLNIDKLIIDEALEKLEPDYKKVITLKYYDNMTTRNIAREMNKPEGTIKTWAYRAIKQLRDILKVGGE